MTDEQAKEIIDQLEYIYSTEKDLFLECNTIGSRNSYGAGNACGSMETEKKAIEIIKEVIYGNKR